MTHKTWSLWLAAELKASEYCNSPSWTRMLTIPYRTPPEKGGTGLVRVEERDDV